MDERALLQARLGLMGSLAGAIVYGLLRDQAGGEVAGRLAMAGGNELVRFSAEWGNGHITGVDPVAEESVRTWRQGLQETAPQLLDTLIGETLSEALRAFADVALALEPAERRALKEVAEGVAARWMTLAESETLSEAEVTAALEPCAGAAPGTIISDWSALAVWLSHRERRGSGGAIDRIPVLPEEAVGRLVTHLEREVPRRLERNWRERSQKRDGAWAEVVVVLLAETLQRLARPEVAAGIVDLRVATAATVGGFLPQLRLAFVQAHGPLVTWLRGLDGRLGTELQTTRLAVEAEREQIRRIHELLGDFIACYEVPAAEAEHDGILPLSARERREQVEAGLRGVADRQRSRYPAVADAIEALLVPNADLVHDRLALALGETDADRPLLLRMHGDAELVAGQVSKARDWYVRSLQERDDGADQREGFARALMTLGLFADAEKVHKIAVTIRLRNLGKTHYRTARALMDLGALYLRMGRHDEAVFTLENVNRISREALGQDTVDALECLNRLGAAYFHQGKPERAEETLRLSADRHVATFGRNHLSTAASLNNLAWLLHAVGRFEEAEPLYLQALEAADTAPVPEPLRLGQILRHLAQLLQATGRFEEAEPRFRQGLQIAEEALGPEHPATAMALNDLAGLLYAQKRYDEAEPLYRRGQSILVRALGNDHPRTRACRENLSRLQAERAGQLAAQADGSPSEGDRSAERPGGIFGGIKRLVQRRGKE